MIGSSRNIWDFEPRSVPGCSMWLDGADPAGTGVPPSAGTLATWIDKSGNGRNGVQYSSLSRPQFVTNSLNSKGGVSFTAASSNCYQTQVVLPTPGTIFVVGFSSNDGFILSGIPTPNSGHPPYYATFARDVEFGVNNTSDTAHSANVGSTSNVNYILTGLYTGSNVTAMMNSGILSNTVAFSGTPKTPVTTLIGINSYAGSLGAPLGGTINEFITYSVALTITERQQIEGYLAHKWGLTAYYLPRTPLTIPGCQLWLDASDSSTITRNGVNMTQWNDKSGTGKNMVPFSTFSNATISSNYQNNLNVLNFSGAGVYQAPASSIIYPVDLYIVMALKDLTTNVDAVAMTASAVDNFNSLTFSEYTASRWHNGSSGFSRTPNTVSTSNETSTSFLLINWSISNNNFVIRRNGTLMTQTASYTWTPTAASIFQIGFRASPSLYSPASVSGAFRGYIGEIVAFNSQLGDIQRQTIEGYLGRKWGLTTVYSAIPSIQPFYSIRPFSRRFNPIDIPDCALWLDGADRLSITLSGSNVTQWNDKSGNGRNLTQTTSGLRPTYSAASNAIVFDGTRYLDIPNALASITPTYTIFLVEKRASGEARFLVGQRLAVANVGLILGYNGSTTAHHTTAYIADLMTTIPSYLGASEPVRITRYSYTGTTRSTFINGGQLSNSQSFSNTLTVWSNANIGAGYNTSSTNWYIGNVHEMIFYNTSLTTEQSQRVEGYLAYKWGIRSTIPATHPFKTFPSSSALPFSPTGISGCSLWLDPADVSTVTLNGSNVSQLRDKSGLGYHMSQTTSANQPTYSTSLNGNRMLTFTQSSSTRLSNTSFPSFIGSGSASYFLVEYNMSAPSGNPSPFGYSAGANFGLIMQYNPGFTGGLQPFSSGVSSFTSATPRLIFLYKPNVTSSNMTGFINGTSQTVSDTTSGTYSGTFSIGSGPNGFISGNICELIVFNRAVTTSERQQVEGYLADKWGVKSSLSSTHPYRSFAPSFVGVTAPDSGYSNFLWTRFYNITSDPSINGPGSSGWGSLIGTAGAYNPINYQDSDSRIGQSDFVGVISKGFMYSATATVVTFRTISDDGIVVIFNGSNVIQNWTYHGDTVDTSASVTLPAGYTPIELRFFEWGGGFTCELSWSIGSTGSYVSDGTSRMFHNNTSKT